MRTRLNIFLAFVVLALMPINNLSAQITTSAKVKKQVIILLIFLTKRKTLITS